MPAADPVERIVYLMQRVPWAVAPIMVAMAGACAGAPASQRSLEVAGGGSMAGPDVPAVVAAEPIDVRAHLLASAEGSASEEAPSGVPTTWDWVTGATPTRTTPPSAAYTHANYWGAIFRGPQNATPT